MDKIGSEVRRHMSLAERTVHYVMILCTVGFWYPVYRARKSKIGRTTDIYRVA